MSKYPPYACSCCGVTNNDMFYDYYHHEGKEPTDQEVTEFNAYRKMWNILHEEREQMRTDKIVIQRSWRHSKETRARISATKKALKGKVS